MTKLFSLCLLLIVIVGCELFEKDVKPFEKCPLTMISKGAYSDKNSQEVGVIFEAFDCDNNPVGITASDVTGYEVIGGERKPLRTESKAAFYSIKGKYIAAAILVLDTSGSIVQNSGVFSKLKSAAKGFAQKLLSGSDAMVSVVVFDGRQYAFLASLPSGQNVFSKYSEVSTLIDGLNCGAVINAVGPDKLCEDSSTNLYNAVLTGADLSKTLKNFVIQEGIIPADGIYSGNVILFTDGTDEANYVSLAQAKSGIAQNSSFTNFFTIGLASADINPDILKQLGPDGYYSADNESQLASQFDQIASRLNKLANNIKRYAYCTATRNGNVTFELVHNESGEKLTYNFNAGTKGVACNLGSSSNSGRIGYSQEIESSFKLNFSPKAY